MFFAESCFVAEPVAAVQARIEHALSGDGLVDVSSAAYADGSQVMVRAGFGGLGKTVAIQRASEYRRGDTIVMPIRWVATGRLGQLFPALDANLELTPEQDSGTRINFVGSYRPPLGVFGEMVDHLVLHRVAIATAHGFLDRMSDIASATIPAVIDAEGTDTVNGTAQPETP